MSKITLFNDAVKKWLESILEDEIGEEETTPLEIKRALEALRAGLWSDSCPRMKSSFKAELQSEDWPIFEGDSFFNANCMHPGLRDLKCTGQYEPILRKLIDGGSDGCSLCWTYQYYTLLNFVESIENYWQVKL